MNFKRLHPYRFEIFFLSEFLILFGSIIVSDHLYESVLLPLMFIANIIAGLVLMSRRKFIFAVFVILLIISALLLTYRLNYTKYNTQIAFLQMGINFLFYVFVTYEIIKQIWYTKKISSSIIFGLISGYISIGLIGFFSCKAIELAIPGSFQASQAVYLASENLTDSFMYYSYITLLSIGFGDITPVSTLAQKVSVLIGLLGQMYNVIITAIIVGKYLNQLNNSGEK